MGAQGLGQAVLIKVCPGGVPIVRLPDGQVWVRLSWPKRYPVEDERKACWLSRMWTGLFPFGHIIVDDKAEAGVPPDGPESVHETVLMAPTPTVHTITAVFDGGRSRRMAAWWSLERTIDENYNSSDDTRPFIAREAPPDGELLLL